MVRRILLLAVLLAARRACADGAPRDVSAILAPILKAHDLPGMAGAIVTGDEVTAIGAAGVRKRGKPQRIRVGDAFHLGSCTKAMTATLCATLVEEGELSWKTTVGEVFPDVAGMDPAWKKVTLEELLTHRAGAPADLKAGGLWRRLWRAAATMDPVAQRRLLVEGVVTRPPVHPPGTAFLYANAGYAIAGAMAEKVTKTSWEELMRKRLFAPLGMKSAGFGAPGRRGSVDEPRGHRADGTPVAIGPGDDNPPAIGPAGTVHASIGDWAKFVALHLQGARGHAQLLKAATFRTLHTPWPGPKVSYAMGWAVARRPWAGSGKGGGLVLTHNGSNTMWFCVTWLAPEKDFAVLVCCNQGGKAAAKACDEAAWALIRDHLARHR